MQIGIMGLLCDCGDMAMPSVHYIYICTIDHIENLYNTVINI